MEKNSFYNLFLELLRECFDFETQIIDALPNVINKVTNLELKEGLSQHLDETKQQLQRLKSIFKALNENPSGRNCIVLKAMIADTNEFLTKDMSPATKDAYLIISCQKIEHYEITCYGSLIALANCLRDWQKDDRVDFEEIIEQLELSLGEEKDADEKLTDIAEGGFFTTGINEEARYEADQAVPKNKL
jgi:ferritin-like metal-binding protein YciE